MTGRLYARDALKAGFCRRGVKAKCERLGVDFQKLRKEGIPMEEARAVDDAQIAAAVKIAEARIAKEQTDGN